jgi:phage shock protein A
MAVTRAIWSWIRAFGYLMTGQINEARKSLDSNPIVMRAKYDEIVEEKKRSVQQFMGAVAQLMTQREMKALKLRTTTDEIVALERQKAGAIAMAKKLANGRPEEEIQKNATEWTEYQKFKMFYNDFSSTAETKKTMKGQLAEDIKAYDTKIADHTVTLTRLKKEIENLKTKAADNVARIIGAKQEKELNDMLNGLSTGRSHDSELARMDEMVANAEAGAKISGQLAGTDTARLTAQFEQAASESAANDEFATLVGTKSANLNALPESTGSSIYEGTSVDIKTNAKIPVDR